jgi:outer membrane protein OmpA-like peptidoglycan-associated protein
MKLKTLLYIGLLSSSMMQVYAQMPPSSVAAANQKYEKMAYIDAIKTYESVAAKGYKSVDMFQKLGNSYYFNANLEKAGKWYGELFAMNQPVDAEYYYRYAQCLKAAGDYTKADAMMTQFNDKSGNDARAKLYASQKNYLEVIKANSGRYTIEDAGINGPKRDYGSAMNGNALVFASEREATGVSNNKMQWTNESYTNLFAAEGQTDGSLGKPTAYNKDTNSKYNESTPVFTKDGQTMYFTRNNYTNGKRKTDKDQTTLLKLYVATKNGANWSNIKELPFNSDQYSTAHPALSPDEKTLYFASNMPGTLGQADLWKSSINSDGSYGTPENLGATINTQGRETFPFVSAENELYYATDGRPGLGGLDVVMSQLGKGAPTEPVNVGAPINATTDDFAFIIDNKTQSGYFTSDRLGGHGSDDIYKFKQLKKLVCEQALLGVVTDVKTGDLLANADMVLLDSNMKEIQKGTSDEKANYNFKVECGKTYYVRASKKDYETAEQKITIVNQSGKTNLPIALLKVVVPVKKDEDLAKALNIKMIYFDLDKSYIRADAALELEKILAVMQENPTMVIDIRSHTDCRQTIAYNAALSGRRAKSTMEWLVSKGIKKSRLTAKGYGESQLTNACPCEPTNESSCSEEEHQLNRRSEFIIVSM